MKPNLEYAKKVVAIAVNALEDIKAIDIKVIDTSKLTPLFNSIIVCSGNSSTQVAALARNLVDKLKDNEIKLVGMEGEAEKQWILIDTGEVVIHIMLPAVRNYYDLEDLWDEEE